MAGLEPATFGLEVRRAIQLRHTGSSGNRFRSYDLRVMGPTRFLCATPLKLLHLGSNQGPHG